MQIYKKLIIRKLNNKYLSILQTLFFYYSIENYPKSYLLEMSK